MKNILKYLNRLGFSEIESKLYLLLLKSGPMTVAELAESARINRTATYSYLDSLLQKGVIAKVQGRSKKVLANPPEHLQYLIEQKLTSVLSLKETLPNIVNVLNTSFPQSKDTTNSEIKYYKGKSGAKVIYKECLRSKIVRSYFNCSQVEKIFPENFQLFTDTLDQNPNMTMYEILEDSPESRKKMMYYLPYKKYFYKYLPPDVNLLANDILIYDSKVAIINIGDKNNVTGVVLSNKDYYNNSVQLFDLLWRLLPKPKS